MLLNELLKAIQPVEVAGDSNIEITGVNIDSVSYTHLTLPTILRV